MAPYVAGNAPTRVSIANPYRVSVTLFNPSAVDVYAGKLSNINADGTGNTIPIKANGGSVIFGPPKTYLGDVWIISSGANVTIFVFEDNSTETAAT